MDVLNYYSPLRVPRPDQRFNLIETQREMQTTDFETRFQAYAAYIPCTGGTVILPNPLSHSMWIMFFACRRLLDCYDRGPRRMIEPIPSGVGRAGSMTICWRMKGWAGVGA